MNQPDKPSGSHDPELGKSQKNVNTIPGNSSEQEGLKGSQGNLAPRQEQPGVGVTPAVMNNPQSISSTNIREGVESPNPGNSNKTSTANLNNKEPAKDSPDKEDNKISNDTNHIESTKAAPTKNPN